MRSVLCSQMLIALTWAVINPAIAQDRPTWDTPKPQPPQIAPASAEPQQALVAFRIPAGMIGSVFAAEPDVANAVAIYVDHQGKVWVCESFRQSKGIEDNRGHEHWLDDDLAARTVQDRYDYVVKHIPDAPRAYTEQDDRIRLLVDTDGDHVADRVTVFADGFNELVAGTGAGVLEYRGDVFYTCIPDLWLLRDEDGDGVAEERKSLHYGYGVRYAFRGHDMHGLVIGPDGRLYFSIGDRGYNVLTSDGLGENPDSGAVFRCELDGSRLEVFAMGLRNPQELAFDEFGNLFTGDNNSDSGDRARWVHVVQGGDSGWRMFYQYLPDRGPFNREFLWHPARPEQPAYLLPPVTNFADGPSGLAYYPGTGLSDEFRGRFLLCDFRGQASNSGIRSLRVKPKGASFELVDDQQPFWNILATDVTFGPDGAVYVADWVHGWEGLGKGRVYRFVDAAASKSEIVQQVQQLLRDGLADHDENSLTTLLAHPDQRVRQEAQFELARRGAFEALDGVARNHRNTLARLHAIWGLGQLGRRDERRDETVETIAELLRAKDAEVRAQAATVMGDLEDLSYGDELTSLLLDESPRVRSFAALAIGRLGLVSAAPAVAQLLSDNADSDTVLRHSGAMALAGIARNQPQLVRDLATHPSVAVRRAAVVALRRVDLASTAAFLSDADVLVVEEAARALHDAPRETDLAPLAAIIDRPTDSDALLRRVLNANFRLGGPDRAAALAAFVARGGGQESHRIEALEMLATWNSPGVRDRVIGMHRPTVERDATDAVQALDQNLPLILSLGGAVAEKAVDAAARLGIEAVAPRLIERVGDASLEPAQRASALRALGQLKSDQLQQLALAHVQSEAEPLRIVSLDLLAGLDLSAALPHLKQAVASPSVAERQATIATLRRFESPETRKLIAELAQLWLDGSLPTEIGLDVFEAISELPEEISQPVIDKYRASLNESDPLAPYRLTIAGGNVDRGRTLFYERASLSCIRCHAVNGSGGNVGPELGRIGLDKQPEYLLEAIVAPNQAIAKGFEGVLVQTLDGGTLSGIVRSQTDQELTLINAEGNLIRIAMDDVDQIVPGKSSMPEDLMKYLTLSELRDLVAYLASLRNEAASSAHGAETP